MNDNKVTLVIKSRKTLIQLIQKFIRLFPQRDIAKTMIDLIDGKFYHIEKRMAEMMFFLIIVINDYWIIKLSISSAKVRLFFELCKISA